jgi:hypothetical protein
MAFRESLLELFKDVVVRGDFGVHAISGARKYCSQQFHGVISNLLA